MICDWAATDEEASASAAAAAACGSRLEVKADYFRSGDHRVETDGDLGAFGMEVPSGSVLMLRRQSV